MFDDIAGLEEKLGLQNGFYTNLLKNDDWSFLIKLNALFEAACTHALTQRLSCPELLDDLSQLEFADRRRGKVKFLRSLGVITDQQAKVLYELSELRNRLVHNVAQVSFSIRTYFDELDKAQLKSKSLIWGHSFRETVMHNSVEISRAEFVSRSPKFVLWMTCAEILACLHLEFEMAELRAAKKIIHSYGEVFLPDGGGLLNSFLTSQENSNTGENVTNL